MPNQDRVSDVYKGNLWSSEAQERTRRRIHWLCSQSRGRVLDLGCSQGITSILLARAGFQVVGADVELDRLEHADADRRAEPSQFASRASFLLADGAELPFPDAAFDTILLGELLEHVHAPGAVLAEVSRALTNDGKAAITLPLGFHPHHDHKRTFYPASALRLLSHNLTPLSIDLVDRYIRIVARSGPDRDGAWEHLAISAQPSFEQICLEVEQDRQRLHGELSRVREQRDEARDRLDRVEQESPSALSHVPNSETQSTSPPQPAHQNHRAHQPITPDRSTRRIFHRARTLLRTVRGDPYRVVLSARDRIRPHGTRTLGKEFSAAKRRGDWKEAERFLSTRVRREPPDPLAWFHLAQVQRKLDKTAEASYSALQAVQLRPQWGYAVRLALQLSVHSPRPDHLAVLFRTAQLPRTTPLQPLRQACKILLRAEQYRLAGSAAQHLLDRRSVDPTAVVALAISQVALGRPADARHFLEQHLRVADYRLAEEAVTFFLHIGDPARAHELTESIPDPKASLLVAVGRELVRVGNLSDALDVLTKAQNVAPDHPQAQTWIDKAEGELHALQGHWHPPRIATPDPTPRTGRILHIVGRSLPHTQVGYTLRTHATVRAQKALGMEPHVVTRFGFPDSSQPHAPPELLDGIQHHRIPGDTHAVQRLDDRLNRSIEYLASLVSDLSPSVLHAASDYRNALLAIELARRFDIPVVYEIRGFWEDTWLTRQKGADEHSERYLLRQSIENQCITSADRIVTLSDSMRHRIAARGADPNNVWVIPNAVDPEAFDPSDRDDALAAELGLSPGNVTLGYISTFVEYEGIPYLIDALAKLRARGYPVNLLLVGEGPERARLQAQVRHLGLQDRVTLTGPVPHTEIPRYYRLIDIFVVPRTGDRVCHLVTPLKPYEAMASGRPLVVSSVDALRELVNENGAGLVFRHDDPTSLANTLETLLDRPHHRSKLGAAARDCVLTHHTWHRNAQRYAHLYRELGAL